MSHPILLSPSPKYALYDKVSFLLALCPAESEVTFDGKQFAEMLRKSEDPNRGKGDCIERAHMKVFGHTKNIVRPANSTSDEQLREMRKKFNESLT